MTASATVAHHWPHDDPHALNAFYGNPTGAAGRASLAWERTCLVHVAFPWRAVLAWDTRSAVSTCLVHHLCADNLRRVFARIWDACGHDQVHAEELGVHLFGGAFNYRLVRGSQTKLSVHSWGAAIDLNPAAYPLGSRKKQPLIVVEAFKDEGAIWGGDFHSRKDPMHFQFATE